MLGISKHEEAPPTPQRPLSPLGEACSRMDLTAIHQLLVMTHYRDDYGTNEVIDLYYSTRGAPTCPFTLKILSYVGFSCGYGFVQLSFQEWTQQMRDMLEARKHGDLAFRDKDFKAAIDCYSQVMLLKIKICPL